MSEPLALDREAIGALCRRHDVARLAVYGSATTDRDSESSDVGMTVEFWAGVGLFDSYGLKMIWSSICSDGRLTSPRSALEKPLGAEVARTEQLLYPA